MPTLEYPSKTHHGKGLRVARLVKGYSKQQALADAIGVPQQTISDYERSPVLKDAVIKKFAEFLNIHEDNIKYYPDEGQGHEIIVENNTFQAGSNPVIGIGGEGHTEFNKITNPLEHLVAAYEKIIEAEREKLAIIMRVREEDIKRIEELSKEIEELRGIVNCLKNK